MADEQHALAPSTTYLARFHDNNARAQLIMVIVAREELHREHSKPYLATGERLHPTGTNTNKCRCAGWRRTSGLAQVGGGGARVRPRQLGH